MSTVLSDRRALWAAYGQSASPATEALYRGLVREEALEETCKAKTLEQYADGLIDTAVVALGLLLAIDRYPATCPFVVTKITFARPDLVKFAFCAQEIVMGSPHDRDRTEHLCIALLAECNALLRGERLDPYPLWDEVHRANMSKLDLFGNPIRDVRGKVQKGPHYSPPDIAGVLKRQGKNPGYHVSGHDRVRGLVRDAPIP
jgi:hypothetical protein